MLLKDRLHVFFLFIVFGTGRLIQDCEYAYSQEMIPVVQRQILISILFP